MLLQSDMIGTIGYFGPNILMALSLLLLRKKRILLVFYIFGSIMSVLVNLLLKNLIKEPRPKEDNTNLEWFKNKETNGRIAIDFYGMPSGHAQSVMFSTAFIFLSLRNFKWLTIFLIISGITLKQRYDYKNHTFLQLLVGCIVGMIIGYLFYLQKELYIRNV
jgi:membrane-associated phospholipid phosphatase